MTRETTVVLGDSHTYDIDDITGLPEALDARVLVAGDTMTGALKIDDPTAATSPTTGALVVTGGAGIGGSVHIDDDLVIGNYGKKSFGFYGSTITPGMQNVGVLRDESSLALLCADDASGSPATLIMARATGGDPNVPLTVASADDLGTVAFVGHNGTGYFTAALVRGEVNGVPSATSMPGKVLIATTPAGSTEPLDRVTIGADGVVTFTTNATLVFTDGVATGFPAFNEAVDDRVAAFLVAGTGISFDHDDPGNTFTINSSALLAEVDTLATVTGRGATTTTPIAIDASSASAALRVAQAGAGFVAHFEDATNPDATPFIIDTGGEIYHGHTATVPAIIGGVTPTPKIQENISNTNGIAINSWSGAAAQVGALFFARSLSGTIGTYTRVLNGYDLGAISFAGADDFTFHEAARIRGEVGGPTGTNDMPGRLVFSTTPDASTTPVDRVHIEANGALHLLSGTTLTSADAGAVAASSLGSGSPDGTYVLHGDSVWRQRTPTIMFSAGGVPTAGLVLPVCTVRAYDYAANLSGSFLRCGTAATALSTFELRAAGVLVGNITVAAGTSVGTMPVVSAGSIPADTLVTLVCPSPADATLASPSFGLAVTRTS